MLMKNLSFNKPLLYSLITAFIFLQWSATHIHLAGEHEHDRGKHQHQLVSHHHDVIDVSSVTLSHAESHKVVELEHICTQFHGKLSELYTAIPSTSWVVFEQKTLSESAVTSYEQDVSQTYHQYTSIRLRAPPIAS